MPLYRVQYDFIYTYVFTLDRTCSTNNEQEVVMGKIKTLTLVGGISSISLNKKLYNAIINLNMEEFSFETFDIAALPYFSQDIENDPPDFVTNLKEMIREAEAVLFITPEYNRSFPGVLKNAIDWGSRPYGHNLWNKKPAAILGASPGSTGTFGAQHHLRQSLSYLNMRVMGQPELYFGFADKAFNKNGELINDKSKELIVNFFNEFSDWIKLINSDFRLRSDNKLTQRDAPSIH